MKKLALFFTTGLTIFIVIATAIAKLEWFRDATTILFPTIIYGVCFPGVVGTGGVVLTQGASTSCCAASVAIARGTACSNKGSVRMLSFRFPWDYLRGSIHTHMIYRGILLQPHSRGKVIEKPAGFLVLVTHSSQLLRQLRNVSWKLVLDRGMKRKTPWTGER